MSLDSLTPSLVFFSGGGHCHKCDQYHSSQNYTSHFLLELLKCFDEDFSDDLMRQLVSGQLVLESSSFYTARERMYAPLKSLTTQVQVNLFRGQLL